MATWAFTDRDRQLLTDLTAIDAAVPESLDRVIVELDRFEPDIWRRWVETGVIAKAHTYCLRYVVPLHDLLRSESRTSVEALTVQLLSCICWRHFDNALDGHDATPTAHVDLTWSVMRLYAYAQQGFGTTIRPALEKHFHVMASQARAERTSPVPLDDIWTRCSIFLFAPETIATLSAESLDAFKIYINYSGLAHDAHDLLSDLASGVASLPARWMSEVNPDAVFSVGAATALYARIRREADRLEREWERVDAATRWPLIHHLWLDSWKTIHHD